MIRPDFCLAGKHPAQGLFATNALIVMQEQII